MGGGHRFLQPYRLKFDGGWKNLFSDIHESRNSQKSLQDKYIV
jgi:hypothetical protein